MDLVEFLESVAESEDAAYALTADRRLVAMNEAWTRFARANGGEAMLARWTLGACIDDAISPALRAHYVAALARVLVDGQPWEHDYECSSAQLHRRFRMWAYPLEGNLLAVVHTRTLERPQDQPAFAGGPDYLVDGRITMCASCRRVRHGREGKHWHWVPAYLDPCVPDIRHGMCPTCAACYGPADAT